MFASPNIISFSLFHLNAHSLVKTKMPLPTYLWNPSNHCLTHWIAFYFNGARSKGFATLRNVSKLTFYSCPGHRPWVRVIICVVFFFSILYYFSSARKWTNCAIVPMRRLRPSHVLFPFYQRAYQRTLASHGTLTKLLFTGHIFTLHQ